MVLKTNVTCLIYVRYSIKYNIIIYNNPFEYILNYSTTTTVNNGYPSPYTGVHSPSYDLVCQMNGT